LCRSSWELDERANPATLIGELEARMTWKETRETFADVPHADPRVSRPRRELARIPDFHS
jgi:hypothetical protein